MGVIENLEAGERKLYSTGYFSGDYNQDLYLKKTAKDASNKEKFYINVFSKIDEKLVDQGYLYFYLNFTEKTSQFIGIKVKEQFRNLNIGSFLVASWIDLCFNNGYDFLGVNAKQRKPFLLYLLKTYGFEILDKSLYESRPDVISICRSTDIIDKNKYLLFKESRHEDIFTKTNVFKSDSYKIIHTKEGMIHLDDVTLPLQSRKRTQVDYELRDRLLAETKIEEVISRHKR